MAGKAPSTQYNEQKQVGRTGVPNFSQEALNAYLFTQTEANLADVLGIWPVVLVIVWQLPCYVRCGVRGA